MRLWPDLSATSPKAKTASRPALDPQPGPITADATRCRLLSTIAAGAHASYGTILRMVTKSGSHAQAVPFDRVRTEP